MRRWTDEEWAEAYEERAAIMEYDGGASRSEAERRAGVVIQMMRLEVAGRQAEAQAHRPSKPAGPPPDQPALPGMEQAFTGG